MMGGSVSEVVGVLQSMTRAYAAALTLFTNTTGDYQDTVSTQCRFRLVAIPMRDSPEKIPPRLR
jgi:hypothetical protein